MLAGVPFALGGETLDIGKSRKLKKNQEEDASCLYHFSIFDLTCTKQFTTLLFPNQILLKGHIFWVPCQVGCQTLDVVF